MRPQGRLVSTRHVTSHVASHLSPDARQATFRRSNMGESYGWFLAQVLFFLLAVCGLAWLLVRFGGRFLGASRESGLPLRVVARLPLEPRRTLYVVEAMGKALLIGATDHGPMSVIAELDPQAVADAHGGDGRKEQAGASVPSEK